MRSDLDGSLRRRTVAACVLGLILSVSGIGCAEKSETSVILVTVDTLRADRTWADGVPSPTSPSLERLASRGRRYVRAFSASSSTAASHASIFTGHYPSWHTVGSLNGQDALHPETVTLAERLQAQGYRTAAIVSNQILRAEVGLDQGFDLYDDALESTELNRRIRERRADRAVDLALEWIDGDSKAPFFLWLHLQDPHGPYVAHEECGIEPGGQTEDPLPAGVDHSGYRSIPRYQLYGDERAASRYRLRHDCEIARTDAHLGRLLDHLDETGRTGSTLVIVTADHGEALGEDDFYFSHGHSVGPDQVRVPFVIAGPGIDPGEVVDAAVSNVAIFPTLLDYLGLEVPDGPRVRSLLDPRSDPVFTESLNQSGVALGSVYLTRDRRSADDHEFWSEGNPNSGGVWIPLGARSHPIDADSPLDEDVAEQARALLESFDRDALSARRQNADLRQTVGRTDEQLENLRRLGYVN